MSEQVWVRLLDEGDGGRGIGREGSGGRGEGGKWTGAGEGGEGIGRDGTGRRDLVATDGRGGRGRYLYSCRDSSIVGEDVAIRGF